MRIPSLTNVLVVLCLLASQASSAALGQNQSAHAAASGQTTQPPAAPAAGSPVPGGHTEAQPAPAAHPSTPEQDLDALRRLEANYLRAEMEDSATLADTILAEDYIGVRSDGSISGKKEVLDNLSLHSRTRKPYTVTAIDMREHLFGDSACVTYTKIYTVPGRQTTYRESVLHFFTKRNGVWQLQVSSPMPDASSPSPAAAR